MIPIATYLAFVAACAALAIVPGPVVTMVLANSLRHGTRAGLLNIAGVQAGLASMIAILAIGLAAVVAALGQVFWMLRIAGAIYLIWLGIRMWRSDGRLAAATAPAPRMGFALQGLLVSWSNPKTLVFFGAFIPQFVDPAGHTALQVALLGATFMAVAGATDACWAVLAGRAGGLLSRHRVRLLERLSGSLLIGGGAWLATRTG